MLRHDAAVWGARRVMWRQADNPLAPSDKYEVRRTFSAVRLHSVVPTLPLHCQPFIEDVNCKRWWVGWDGELARPEIESRNSRWVVVIAYVGSVTNAASGRSQDTGSKRDIR
ncbi:hypothetical protein ALC60_02066 [Trachymyrmex zeteki]|uniref:Uncharacterized protein n=1 Tax=Mycetomoellerius zeteki TaxID=64791 RepID=A0A151XF49_9HYME|nr:hypothetical protein ALC60_02066 [Trachymyrmex zeteki]